MKVKFLICLLLVGVTLALYWPVRHFEIIFFDDPLFVTENAAITNGLNWHSLWWAFSNVLVANWHPVTSLSFVVGHEFWGTNPGAEHLVNAVIHAANAALLFLLLQQLTKSTWRSAVVAGIFAWHPLRVESVAWISERKDVLCAFYFLLSLLCYARFAETTVRGSRSRVFYGASLLTFVLALLSKPMAVTMPFVLILLDVWPLRRLNFSTLRKLFIEKAPFFALMLVFCAATYQIQHENAAMTSWEKLGLAPRVANAISGWLTYPAQLFWPLNLAAIYPYPKDFDLAGTVLKAALLLAISLGCLVQFARRPWLAIGWFWYLGTVLPVIGIVQVGEQAHADRYTYLPLIGAAVAVVWTAAELFSRIRGGKCILPAMAVCVLSALAILEERQLQFWQNTVTLFAHNTEVTPNNGSAYFTLGLGWLRAGDTNRAIVCFRTAKMDSPRDLQVRQTLADALRDQGHTPEAMGEYTALTELDPALTAPRICLAGLLAAQGRQAESAEQLNEAVRLNPDLTEALNNLAWLLATSTNAAVRDGPRAVQLAEHARDITGGKQTIYLGTLAAAYAEAGRFDDAIVIAQRACESARQHSETNLLQKNQQLMELYRSHKPCRE